MSPKSDGVGKTPILEPCDNEINLPNVYSGLAAALSIMGTNNCFRVVMGCVAD